MSERYVKLSVGDEIIYREGAPIIIRARALLKDTQTGKLLAQLKFQNISGKTVSYVKVAITQRDAVHNVLAEAVSFEYLDLSVADKEQFGSKQPIPIPNASTRAFDVGVSHVGFADGSVWTSDPAEWNAVGSDSNIAKAFAVEDTYAQALVLSASTNRKDVEKAKMMFESIQAQKDVAIEMTLCDKKIAQFDAPEATKQKKRKKIIAISAIAIVVIVAIVMGIDLSDRLVYLKEVEKGYYRPYITRYNVKTFRIPDGETSIDPEEFRECYSLESVTIPDSVTNIGACAFTRCYSLVRISFDGTKAQWEAVDKDTDWDDSIGAYTIYCTDGTIAKEC